MAADAAPTADALAKLRSATGLLAREPARAEAMAREVLANAPENPDGLIVLGTALRLQGALGEARAVLQPLAAAQRGSGSRSSNWPGSCSRSARAARRWDL